MKAEENLQEQIIDTLRDVPSGLTSRRIHSLINNVGIQEISSCLRHLQISGHVQLTSGTVWQWTGKTYITPVPSILNKDENVEETHKMKSSNQCDLSQQATKIEIPQNTRWDEFRRLCLYYAECTRLEDKAKVHSYADLEGRGFVTLTGFLNFRPLASGGILHIEIKDKWAKFLRTIHQRKSNPRFYIAYPIHIYVFKDKTSGENKQGLYPIFVQQVECSVYQDSLEIKSAGPVEVNNDWLENRFKRNAEDRQAFLEQMELYLSEESYHQYQQPNFKRLSELLKVYYPNEFCEYPNISKLDQAPGLHEIEQSGHYNRAVLISQQKLKYAERLFKELLKLATKEDDKLDRSALKYLFNHTSPSTLNHQSSTDQETDTSTPFLPGLAEYEPMDEKQREACRYAMSEPLTIINGPPGTGKSRVVAQIMANTALTGQTALFASKNHQAIEAVVPRLNGLVKPDMLVISTARKYGSEDAMNLAKALIALLDTPRAGNLEINLQNAKEALCVSLEHLERIEAQRAQFFRDYHELDCEEQTLSAFLESLPEYANQIEKLPDIPTEQMVVKAVEELRDFCAQPLGKLQSWMWKIRRLIIGETKLGTAVELENKFCETFNEKIIVPQSVADMEDLKDFTKNLERRKQISQALNLAKKVHELRKEVRRNLNLQQCHQDWLSSHETVQRQTENTLKLLAKSFGMKISGAIREDFAGIRGFLQIKSQLTDSQKKSLENALDHIFPKIIKHIPLWATANLSVGRNVPLVPGSFDLVIIDESSQCDIASVIPLLYRAKRIVVAGDPMQLPHVSTMKGDVAARTLEKYGLTDIRFGRYLYPANSFYDLASTSGGLTKPPVVLQSHHRSHPTIANYCNEMFYGGTLQIMTNLERIHAPTVDKHRIEGFQWTDVPADAESGRGSGAISSGQIDAIIEEIQRLRRAHFPGTVGVVTPFRSQANRIRDRIHQEFGPEIPNHWRFLAHTADGYQGDERDVMFLSIPCGDLPRGAKWFLETQKNRFNVAVSRARAVLHVVSDKAWCMNSGIPHIEKLAQFALRNESSDEYIVRSDLIGPVWEPKLADALKEAGIHFLQQYPACGRFLDFAILRKKIKLNIEVDGEAYHRTVGGDRKIDDLNRDLVLVANGWRVVRFWVYQLREDMKRCIEMIQSTLVEMEKYENE